METFYLNLREQDAAVATHEHEHELHRSDCPFFPTKYQEFRQKESSEDAILAARIWAAMYHNEWYVDGCAHCCPEIDSDNR